MFFSLFTNLLLVAAAIISGSVVPEVASLSFNYTSFPDQTENDFLRNTSYIVKDAIQVTPDVNGDNITNESGRIFYNRQLRLWRKKRSGGRVRASFNTTFEINVTPQTDPGGEGLAFVLTGDPVLPENSHGQWLGIVNENTNGKPVARIVAVEFDTRKSFPEDLDDNHVGLDVNSVYSINSVSLTDLGVNISSGKNVIVNIRYDGENLTVFIENMTNPVISQVIDLSKHLPQKVFVGFSGSTSQYTELNCVRSWVFIGSDIKDANLLWVWIVVPVGLVLMIVALIFWFWRTRKSKIKGTEDAFPNIEAAIHGSSTAPKKFKLKELSKATDNFNPNNKLGKGGFGTVYKGILGDTEVAVKRVSKKSTQGKREFVSEVITIGNLHHRNLVKLIGWCYEKHEYLLVYECMPHGSLEKYIYQDAKYDQQSTLSWRTRLGVISGVAQALDYLHNGCEKKVLHRDIKASNVMLDSEFNAKLGDFGLARTINPSNQTHHSTKEFAGTLGFIAPETLLTQRATTETDIYAFGILLLEVACGRKPGGQAEENDYISNIVHWIWELYANGQILDGADPRLVGEFECEEMKIVLILGLACCHPDPNNRPSMKTVLQVLKGDASAPEVPTERPRFVWPPLPPSFKDSEVSLRASQLTAYTEFTGR